MLSTCLHICSECASFYMQWRPEVALTTLGCCRMLPGRQDVNTGLGVFLVPLKQNHSHKTKQHVIGHGTRMLPGCWNVRIFLRGGTGPGCYQDVLEK